MSQSLTPTSREHVDLISSCGFEETLQALEARLGKTDTGELMDRLRHASDWADYEVTCLALAGSSGLIEVGRLDWGQVLTLAGTPMKACCLIIGNPLTARKLLAAGGARVGLYLPTKIIVFEDEVGDVHVAYDRFEPVMAGFGAGHLTVVAAAIDHVLASLAAAAAAGT